MARFTDGRRTVEIDMRVYHTDRGYSSDYSIEFFSVGSLEYDQDLNAYVAEDVQYLIDQAFDWERYKGDFCDQVQQEAGQDREVFIEEVE